VNRSGSRWSSASAGGRNQATRRRAQNRRLRTANACDSIEGPGHGNRATKSAAEVEDGGPGASRAPAIPIAVNLEIPSCQATCRPYRPPTEAKNQEVIRRHRRTLQSSKTRSTTMRPKRAIPRTSNKIKQIRVSFEAGGKVSRYVSRGMVASARSATGSWRQDR
jgi:hypothetical protein